MFCSSSSLATFLIIYFKYCSTLILRLPLATKVSVFKLTRAAVQCTMEHNDALLCFLDHLDP